MKIKDRLSTTATKAQRAYNAVRSVVTRCVNSVKSVWAGLKRGIYGTLRGALVLGRRVSTKYWILAIFVGAGVCNVVSFYAGPISLAAAVLVWSITSYRNPPIQPILRLKTKRIQCVDGFCFYGFGGLGLPEWMKPARNESGLMWEGFGMGVSRLTGKVESFAVYLYGSNEGVGHYSYKARDNAFRGSYGEGHFNLMPFEKGSASWEWRVLSSAGEMLSRDIGQISRPLDVSYDEKGGSISMYDPESGRDVYFNTNRSKPLDDLFVFGPYPRKLAGVTGKESGLLVGPADTSLSPDPRLHLSAQDIYGRPVKHVRVSIQTESGYRYSQSFEKDVLIAVPRGIENARVLAERAGYKELTADVGLEDGIQRIVVVLEPSRGEE